MYCISTMVRHYARDTKMKKKMHNNFCLHRPYGKKMNHKQNKSNT